MKILVLIVDHDPVDARLLSVALEGMNTVVAHSVIEAFEEAQRPDVSAAVIDLTQGTKTASGIRILQRIRELREEPEFPGVLVTDRDLREIHMLYPETSGMTIIPKNENLIQDLRVHVESLLRLTKGPRTQSWDELKNSITSVGKMTAKYVHASEEFARASSHLRRVCVGDW